MKLVQLVFVFTVLYMSVAKEVPRYRISNGFHANPEESAYVARLMALKEIFPNYQLLPGQIEKRPAELCTGTLISNHHVLTAAHCFTGAESVIVYLGIATIHERGLELSCRYCWALHHTVDMAVIRLPEKIQFSNNIQAIRLPTRSDHELDLTGKSALIHGWGRTGNGSIAETLQSLEVTLPSTVPFCDNEKHICFIVENERTAAPGDSGGPLVLDGKLFGVLQGGMNLTKVDSDENMHKIVINVYNKVTYCSEWISRVTGIKN